MEKEAAPKQRAECLEGLLLKGTRIWFLALRMGTP